MNIFSKISDALSGRSGQSQIPPDMQMPPQNNIQFAPSTGADYPESFYRHQTEIRKVESAEDMTKWIDDAGLSLRCENALKSLVANLYDDNIILSHHNNPIEAEISYLEAKVFLWSGVLASAYKSDTNNPSLGLIMHELFFQLKLRFTRTIGADRERIVQGKIVQTHEIRQQQYPLTPQTNR